MPRTRILILGAAGKDFHVFNTMYRDDEAVEVVGFTAQQIPHIDDRSFPASIAGELYPDGIPIFPEDEFVTIDVFFKSASPALYLFIYISFGLAGTRPVFGSGCSRAVDASI